MSGPRSGLLPQSKALRDSKRICCNTVNLLFRITMDDLITEGALRTPVVTYPIEIYTPERIAEFRLNNALDFADYQAALKEVRKMGLDPKYIEHQPIKKGRR